MNSSSIPSSHTSLYRKYRPATWAEVIGQQHIVSILEQEAQKPRPNHAFLFAGSRGTGKTTIARIFAKSIGTAPEDIYEIDAASHTSVEDIRSLTESVHTLPLTSPFKVYILDEVHMLSKSAFNAFLKTLEEPPQHVIFILATTELHKIPDTIISRCQVFQFNTPTTDVLQTVIINLGKKEGRVIEEDAAKKIAQFGRGSFRDTLSHLQGVFTLFDAVAPNTPITAALVETHMSTPPLHLIESFIDICTFAEQGKGETHTAPDPSGDMSPLRAKCAAALAVLDSVGTSPLSMELFFETTITELRHRLLASVRSAPRPQMVNIGSVQGASSLEARTVSITALYMHLINILLTHATHLGNTHAPTLPLELATISYFTSLEQGKI